MSVVQASMLRRCSAECVGTFCLVFMGTGAIVVNEVSNGAIGHIGVALVFGLAVLALISAFGDVSGAHMNPAVSLAFWVSGRFPGKGVAPYVVAQFLGALVASLLVRVIFPDAVSLGSTIPTGSTAQSFVLEVVLAAMLMLVILGVSHGPKEKGLVAGTAIGAFVGLEALFAGPISGASMNPARSLAPALVAGAIGDVWIYLVAPTIGALIAVPLSRAVLPRDKTFA